MRFAITGSLEKEGLRGAIELLVTTLEGAGADYRIDKRVAPLLGGSATQAAGDRLCGIEECFSGADVLVAFGGDGTILSAAHEVGAKGIPILGVNLGKLGFLAEFAVEEIPKAITDLLAKKYLVEERLVLKAVCRALPGRDFFAVNDIVVDKSRSSRIMDVEAHIDGAFAVTYRGDGLIISTPGGSTAYALSNGGPIVIPASRVIGITPISPHSLSGRPLIVPDSCVVRVVVRGGSEEIMFSADGRSEGLMKPPAEIVVQKADYPVKLVKRVDRSYFDVLRAKLFWGQDARSS